MIVVFGAVGWQTIAREGDGTIDVRINGAGYDVATAIAALQAPCRFVTSLSTGRIGDLFRIDMDEVGLDAHIHPSEGLPFSGSITWQKPKQTEIFSAHPAFKTNYPPTFITGALIGAEYVVCELGFTDATLDAICGAADEREIPLVWILRAADEVERLRANPRWHKHGVFIAPVATLAWENGALEVTNLLTQGALTLSPEGDVVWLLEGSHRRSLPIARATAHPESRFAAVTAAVINEMNAWKRSLTDAAVDCGPAFQEWEDPIYTDAADLERKIASFYKNVENLEHDALTGILTRGTAEKLLASRMLDSPLSMILVDVDHFKRVNDTLGHAEGDKVLIQVAKHLVKEIRKKDVAVRWGGEEFVVFLPGTSEEIAAIIAERIRVSLHQITTEIGSLSASLGVSEKRNESIDQWIHRADTRLYTAKKNGRDQVVAADQD
jgi:diguanylate cyclase (GGDEF)-like protein